MIFDAHAHYDDHAFDEDRDGLLASMEEKGIGYILNSGSDIPSSEASVALAKRFPGGKIVFDATTAKGLKNMLKTWLKDADMQTVGLYFSVEDEKHLAAWSGDFASVVRKGYMTDYRKLDRRYGFLANALFRIVDRSRMCQIIEIDFT